jgi:hypothetical protein
MTSYKELLSGIKLAQEKKLSSFIVLKSFKVLDLLGILLLNKIILGYEYLNSCYKVYVITNNSHLNKFIYYKRGISLIKLKKLVAVNPQSLFIVKTSKGLFTFEDSLAKNLSGFLYLKVN